MYDLPTYNGYDGRRNLSVNDSIDWFALSSFTQSYNVCKLSVFNQFPEFVLPRSKTAVRDFTLWSSSSSVLHRKKTHPNVRSTVSTRCVTSMYYRNCWSRISVSILLLTQSKSLTLATKSSFSFSPPLLINSSMYLFFQPLESSQWQSLTAVFLCAIRVLTNNLFLDWHLQTSGYILIPQMSAEPCFLEHVIHLDSLTN